MIYPWHQSAWNKLVQSHRTGRLAHGLLFHGNRGTGKHDFAKEFASWLICEQNQNSDAACGQCRSCHLLQGETYPDYIELYPEESGKAIKVDQVRELIEKVSLTGHGAGMRVVIISPAEAMNINAANSLLKTLEEPPAQTVILLVSEKPSQLLPTIRSRTQMIRMEMPGKQASLDWLKTQNIDHSELLLGIASGSPLLAASLATQNVLDIRQSHFQNWEKLASGEADALTTAASWLKDSLKISPELPLNWIHSWILDMIRVWQLGEGFLVNTDQAKSLQNLARQVDLSSLYNLLDRVNDTFRLLNGAANQQSLIEGVFLHWAGMKRIK